MFFTMNFFNGLLSLFKKNDNTYVDDCSLGGMSNPGDKDYEI